MHANAESEKAAQQLGARAFTKGQDIYFAPGAYQPQTPSGRKLLAHELSHVTQQQRSPRDTPTIQRKVEPEDVAIEMVGQKFTLSAPFTAMGVTLKSGMQVTVFHWDNNSDTVMVLATGVVVPFSVPKTLLMPEHTPVPGVAPYSAGVRGQAATVEKSEHALAAWVAKKGAFKNAKAVALHKAERKRLKDLLKKRQAILNRRLIQQTMFNRFDAIIKKEVDAANKSHGLSGKSALNPNLLKSMLFQESQLGTAGQHLEVPPSHPVKSRFNLGQVIDSSGLALMTMLEREQPLVMTAMMPTMRKDLQDAQKEHAELKKKTSLSSAESTRLAELNVLSGQNWEVFIWSYRAPGTRFRFADMVNAFFATQTPALNMDYAFWIHMAVMWLFEKHKPGRSWGDTIRAYNGSGARARHYRNAVLKRAQAAQQAAKTGRAFIPGKI